jgi:hypothetical protein
MDHESVSQYIEGHTENNDILLSHCIVYNKINPTTVIKNKYGIYTSINNNNNEQKKESHYMRLWYLWISSVI